MGSTADRIKDIGPQPQSFDIERATKENTNYRSVAWSGRYLQVTLMSIPAGADIGLEAHPETDQFLRLDAGSGRVQMGAAKDKLTFEKEVSDGWCVLVPAGTWHKSTKTTSQRLGPCSQTMRPINTADPIDPLCGPTDGSTIDFCAAAAPIWPEVRRAPKQRAPARRRENAAGGLTASAALSAIGLLSGKDFTAFVVEDA